MTYKVIPLALQGRRKYPFEAGELVTAADLPGQDLESLVKNGWLIPCEQKSEGVETGDQEIDPIVTTDGIPAVAVEQALEPAVIPEYSSITKLQLIEALMAKGVMFNPASEKKELFALLYTTSEVV